MKKPKKTRKTPARKKARKARRATKYVLRLYVAGATARSQQAILRARELCETELEGNYELEVIDIYQRPILARDGQIVATPTLVKEFPLPVRRLIGNLANGSVLAAVDLAPAEVDLAEDNAAPVTRSELAIGRTLTRALRPGQSVRLSHLKTRQWFNAGETVLLMGQGEGFSVAGEAQALNPGIEGVPVRVRTESGRVLPGMPVGERRVELSL